MTSEEKLDSVLSSFKWLQTSYITIPTTNDELVKQARASLEVAFQRFHRKPLPQTIDLLFIQIWYGFYPNQFTLQCIFITPRGPFMSDPSIWPMGNFATISHELVTMGA